MILLTIVENRYGVNSNDVRITHDNCHLIPLCKQQIMVKIRDIIMINDEKNGFISLCGTFMHLESSNICNSEDKNQ